MMAASCFCWEAVGGVSMASASLNKEDLKAASHGLGVCHLHSPPGGGAAAVEEFEAL